MNWSEAEAKFKREHGQDLSQQSWNKWNYQQWGQRMSIAGLWSFRGAQWRKVTGRYPDPEEVGLDPNHDFFNPDVICTSWTQFANGKRGATKYFHHGRKLQPGDRLYPKPGSLLP